MCCRTPNSLSYRSTSSAPWRKGPIVIRIHTVPGNWENKFQRHAPDTLDRRSTEAQAYLIAFSLLGPAYILLLQSTPRNSQHIPLSSSLSSFASLIPSRRSLAHTNQPLHANLEDQDWLAPVHLNYIVSGTKALQKHLPSTAHTPPSCPSGSRPAASPRPRSSCWRSPPRAVTAAPPCRA